jgi:hypothetical protein
MGSAMKLTATLKGLAVGLAVLGFCLPEPLLAAGQADAASVVVDVQLQEGAQGNVLVGQVTDPQGSAKVNVPVVLYAGQQRLAVGRTDGNGRFAFGRLHGGVYQLITEGGQATYRVWTPGTAPPSAHDAALVIASDQTVRGQYGGRLRNWLANPWVIAGIVATAVAIPVALHNAQKDDATPGTP